MSKHILGLLLLLVLFSCKEKKATVQVLTDEQKHDKAHSLNSLQLADGLEATLFAAEPMLLNPTNIDVDTKGRVWVCEAYNYRPEINGNPTKPEGDRIVILEDTNSDGLADSNKVFYQGPELNSPLGIAILGNKVYVSQSPYIWIFTDENGDDKADRKEILFQGIQGIQHDHGAHAIVFGPDGKLYFTLGNEGKTLFDKNNKPVKTIDGFEINEKNFKQGLTLRCDLDGSNVEVLGHNFRNNYEPAIDPYGTIWQSDNDDDGNKGTRINYVMQHGNYGYTDEITGAGWRTNRTNIEKEVPLKHWHLNDPGVVPNLLQTYAGSPSGMIYYTGTLLPAVFQNKMIHCEPGNNVLRAYTTTPTGAGYSATIENIAKDTLDQWFRPVDVAAAPDGSIFVADWYDPGVGGHEAGDQSKGRIYRIAPKGHKYEPKSADLSSVAASVAALNSPNQAIRFVAFHTLKKFGDQSVSSLAEIFEKSSDQNHKARAFWLLAQSNQGAKFIAAAASDKDPNMNIAAIRAAQMFKINEILTIKSLINSPNAQVRRECALALRLRKETEAPALWASLASQHDGQDRWYLEALGIAAQGNDEAYLQAYLAKNPNPLTSKGGADIIWRSRAASALVHLEKLATDSKVTLEDRLRYFRAFDFHNSPIKNQILISILSKSTDNNLSKVVLNVIDTDLVKKSPSAVSSLEKVLVSLPDSSDDYYTLIDKFGAKSQQERLLTIVESKAKMNAAKTLINIGGASLLEKSFYKNNDSVKTKILDAVRWVGNKNAISLLQNIAKNKQNDTQIRKLAYHYIGNSSEGEKVMLTSLKANAIPKEYIPAAVEGLTQSWKKVVREEARKYLGPSKTGDGKVLPTIVELTHMKGKPENGMKVFKAYCATCHKIGNEGIDFGPNLSAIGAKLTHEALYSSIIHPDLGISFGYEGWDITLKDGTSLSGIITSKTETDIILKMPGGATQNIKTSQIKTKQQMANSVMPAGLQESMTTQELVDLVAYLKVLGR